MNTPESSPWAAPAVLWLARSPGTRVPSSDKVAGCKEGGDALDEAEALGEAWDEAALQGRPSPNFVARIPRILTTANKASAMSRTTFALHFRTAAGVAPLTYLTGWRMRLAERALRDETTPVAVVARTLGYSSESAFSNAFKRETGKSPSAYRNDVKTSIR